MPFDKLKLMVTAGGGTVAGVAGTATKLLAATNPFTLAFGVFGLSAVIFRQAMKFFHTRNHYMMVLAQNLYFCSLANNRGALTLIADGAEEEDVKEDMLLYAFLARAPLGHDALPQLKTMVTRFLAERCGVSVNFDAEDALKRLRADGLVSADADGRFSAIAPEDARAHLDRLWDRLLDVDSLDRQAKSSGAMMHQASIEADASQAERIVRALEEAVGTRGGRGRAVRSRTWPVRDLRPLRRAASARGAAAADRAGRRRRRARRAPHRGAAGSRLGDAVARASAGRSRRDASWCMAAMTGAACRARQLSHRDRRRPSLRHGASCLDARLPARARRHSQAAAAARRSSISAPAPASSPSPPPRR